MLTKIFKLILSVCTFFLIQSCTQLTNESSNSLRQTPAWLNLPPPKQAKLIDSSSSMLTIFVKKSGLLQVLGHDHVIATHDLSGWVLGHEQALITLPLTLLTIDEANLRTKFNLNAEVPEDAKIGTRENMLEKMLDSKTYPSINIRVISIENDPSRFRADVYFQGVVRQYILPLKISEDKNLMKISGQQVIRLSDFGVKPFSILGGTLSVDDQLSINFEINTKP